MTVRELSPDAYRDIHIAVNSLEEVSIAVRLFMDTALQLFSVPQADPPSLPQSELDNQQEKE
ncbi:hypothetical protein D3C81_2266310 [compost metagenome]